MRIRLELDLTHEQLETLSRRVLESRALIKDWGQEDELTAMLKQALWEAQRIYNSLDNMEALRAQIAHSRRLEHEVGGDQ